MSVIEKVPSTDDLRKYAEAGEYKKYAEATAVIVEKMRAEIKEITIDLADRLAKIEADRNRAAASTQLYICEKGGAISTNPIGDLLKNLTPDQIAAAIFASQH